MIYGKPLATSGKCIYNSLNRTAESADKTSKRHGCLKLFTEACKELRV